MSLVHVEVTLLLHTKQRAYGVPNGEFLKYSEYCTRKISRIRHFLRKSSSTVGLKGPHFDLSPALNQNAEHLEIVLFQADSAWSRYRYLKSTAEKPGRRFHAIRRLRKSQKWWSLALECSVAFCTEQTQVEVRAHQSYSRGYLEIESGDWQRAFSTFSEVFSVFTELKTATQNSLLCSFCEDICSDITPLLTFCEFNLGITGVSSVDSTVRERVRGIFSASIDPTRVRQLTELKWRNKVIPIVHETLKTKLGSLMELIEESHRGLTSLTHYDRIITESHSVRQTIRSLPQNEELTTIDNYCNWQQFLARVERSRMVLSGYKTAIERAEHAGKTIGSITTYLEEFKNEPMISILELGWKAVKLLNIAESRRGPEVIGLLGRGKQNCEEALQKIGEIDIEDLPEIVEWIQNILSGIRKARITAIALENGVTLEITMKSGDIFVVDDLDSFTSCSKLVELPPKPKIINPKPVMFNIAIDEEYLPYPNLEGKRTKKSWFSFF
jgi:signal recognition particle subunit SRP68